MVRFVSDMTYNPASLLELAARTVKTFELPISAGDLPRRLISYLESAHHCVNPKCKGIIEEIIKTPVSTNVIYSSNVIAGVYFDNRVEHIKFVDFCGKYRIPLLQFLCSSKCITSRHYTDQAGSSYMMKKVLLG